MDKNNVISKMNYKITKKENEIFFKYSPNKKSISKTFNKKFSKENPFKILKNLNLN